MGPKVGGFSFAGGDGVIIGLGDSVADGVGEGVIMGSIVGVGVGVGGGITVSPIVKYVGSEAISNSDTP